MGRTVKILKSVITNRVENSKTEVVIVIIWNSSKFINCFHMLLVQISIFSFFFLPHINFF